MSSALNPQPTVLELALMGLVHQQPRSGYALSKLFATTPMGHYSASPGAIYPALKRLEKRGFLEGSVENRESLRPRRVYHPTSAGLEALTSWLASPVKRHNVIHDMPELMLRFALMPGLVDDTGTVRFLNALEARLEAYIDHLDEVRASMDVEVPLHSRLALEAGIRGYRSHLAWTQDARQQFLSQARRSR